MNQIRLRIEKGFENLAGIIYRHRIKTLFIMTVIIGALLSQASKITMDTSMEGLLHPNDPALQTYNAFRDQFGRDEVIIIALRPAEVFKLEFLKMLKALHDELQNQVPYLDKVTSLINARLTRGEGDTLIVEDLLKNWPKTETELAEVRQRALANQMYQNMLLSKDGTTTSIIIRTNATFERTSDDKILSGFNGENNIAPADDTDSHKYLTDAQNTEVVEAVYRLVRKYKAKGIDIYLAGSPVVIHFLKRAMVHDMRKFMALVIVMVAVILFFMFQRISGIVLPLFIVFLSFSSTLSVMVLNGAAFKLPTQVLPSFLLAVGVGTSVHILAIFFQRLQKGADKAEAIVYAMGHSGLAILMTNLTTAAGLISFAGADVAPVADLGIYASVGVMLSFFYTVIFLPAMVALVPIRSRGRSRAARHQQCMDRLLDSISRFATDNPRKILVSSAVLIVLSCFGASQIRFSHDPLQWFPADNTIRMDTETIDQTMRGSMTIELVLDSHQENGWHDPNRLQRLEAATPAMEALRYDDNFVGKAFSLTTILKEIHQALNENHPEAYTIPTDRELIAQEFLLFENSGSDDLEDFVDSQFSKVRFTMKLPFKDAVHYKPFQIMIIHYFHRHFPELDLELTGMISLLASVISNTITSLAKSYCIALAVITVLMVILIGQVRIGLLSMIPNLVPILLSLGIIGYFHFPMDMFTMMVASIAIGLAVDDTIHFMHNFRCYYEASGDPRHAVFVTLQTTGRAMLVTTAVLSLGFFVYTFATLSNIIRFGFLTGITLIAALLADYLLAPALMVLFNKKKRGLLKSPA